MLVKKQGYFKYIIATSSVNKCINLKPLVYKNLFFATAAVSCKALLKGFLNGTCIAKIVSFV